MVGIYPWFGQGLGVKDVRVVVRRMELSTALEAWRDEDWWVGWVYEWTDSHFLLSKSSEIWS